MPVDQTGQESDSVPSEAVGVGCGARANPRAEQARETVEPIGDGQGETDGRGGGRISREARPVVRFDRFSNSRNSR